MSGLERFRCGPDLKTRGGTTRTDVSVPPWGPNILHVHFYCPSCFVKECYYVSSLGADVTNDLPVPPILLLRTYLRKWECII